MAEINRKANIETIKQLRNLTHERCSNCFDDVKKFENFLGDRRNVVQLARALDEYLDIVQRLNKLTDEVRKSDQIKASK